MPLRKLVSTASAVLYFSTIFGLSSATAQEAWTVTNDIPAEGIDQILPVYEGELGDQATLYAGGEDMKNPLILPVYGDFSNFPPAQLVTGTRDLLLSPTIRAHRAMRAVGVEADLNVYEGVSHGEFLIYTDLPESVEVFTELGAFLDKHLK